MLNNEPKSQVKGQVNGQTILAMPVGVEKIVKVAAELQETKTCNIDLYLKGAIEGVVIKWATQINDVMIDTPLNAFNGGQNPLPSIGKFPFLSQRTKQKEKIMQPKTNRKIQNG